MLLEQLIINFAKYLDDLDCQDGDLPFVHLSWLRPGNNRRKAIEKHGNPFTSYDFGCFIMKMPRDELLSSEWIKGHGNTPSEAVQDLWNNVKRYIDENK